MKNRLVRIIPILITPFVLGLYSCSSICKLYEPDKKFSKQALQSDFNLLRNILEKKHPSLYWYTPKDSMNFFLDSLSMAIPDSMTELQFGWKILAPLTQKIHCGHTSFGMSKCWGRYIQDKRIPSFPLYLKAWADTMMVVGNLNRNDSVLKPGTLITAINNINNKDVLKEVFNYLPTDGYSNIVNYIRISNNFPYYHRNIFGIYKNYKVGYIDSVGNAKNILIPMWVPPVDSSKKVKIKRERIPQKQLKKDRIESFRSLQIDASQSTAILTLNTFSAGRGLHLRKFINNTFEKINEEKIKNLIIDLRGNGGGDITMHVLLTKYLRTTPFKVADSAYAIARGFGPFTKYIKNGFFNNLVLPFVTKKKKDGLYHFGYWERHLYKPKTENHFDGKVYVLINGPTFSASTLFCNALKGQPNVTLIGEEAGGGWHGNNGIMIPDIKLPNTKLRVRLPFFRLVQFNHVPKDGRGVLPDIYVPPTSESVKKGIDKKMETAKQLIKQSAN